MPKKCIKSILDFIMKNIISFFSNKVLNKNFVPILSLADSLKKE